MNLRNLVCSRSKTVEEVEPLAEKGQCAKNEDTLPVPYERIGSKKSSVQRTKTETCDEEKCLEARREVSCYHWVTEGHIGPSTKFEESEKREKYPSKDTT